MTTPFMLFAEAIAPSSGPAPTWTDKEVMVAILGLVGASIPVIWGVVKFCTIGTLKQLQEAKDRISQLERASYNEPGDIFDDIRQRAEDAEEKAAVAVLAKVALQDEVARLEAKAADLRKEADGYRQVSEAIRGELAGATAERDTAAGERDATLEQLETERRRIRKAADKDGAIWGEKVLASRAVEFKPLDPDGRRTPIVSVLNLKGGVGKTTAVTNLGSAFAHLGYRVLLVDLDLQGSLTGMFLDEKRQREVHEQQLLIGDFLEAAFDSEFPKLDDYAVPLDLPTNCAIVPTTDELAYAEMSLNVRWFLRDSKRDPRFLLRKELHLRRVTNAYDIVLLDCPPLLNVSCVNALAASDFVLVPTIPSKQSADRVVTLVRRVKDLHQSVNAALGVMGIFGNRTKQSVLTSDERAILTGLRDKCLDVYGHPVPLFETFVRQSADVRASEEERSPFGPGDAMFDPFTDLAREVESRLPMFCRTSKAVATPAEEVTT